MLNCMNLGIILFFVVDFLLILGTNRLCGYPPGVGKAAIAAVAGSIYAWLCIQTELAFLGHTGWWIACLLLLSTIAFGLRKSALRRGVVFMLLKMAIGGAARWMGSGGFLALAASVGCVLFLCFFGIRENIDRNDLVHVELFYGGAHMRLTALRDTGNTLHDPITGRPVLVVGPKIAHQLIGLSAEQLRRPVEFVGTVPGLRLVPYRSVNTNHGLLLALKIPRMKIGTWQGSGLVAFAPEGLESEESFQALTGGIL